jgi:hypothetical protein
MKITWSEVIAWGLLNRGTLTADNDQSIHEAADEIILLAEKIKAERATAAMEESG